MGERLNESRGKICDEHLKLLLIGIGLVSDQDKLK